jgi:FxLD family lantipeptide
MNASTIEHQSQPTAAANDPFDLDISVLESGDGSATLINLTDDGCKASCEGSCATAVALPTAPPILARAATSRRAGRPPGLHRTGRAHGFHTQRVAVPVR